MHQLYSSEHADVTVPDDGEQGLEHTVRVHWYNSSTPRCKALIHSLCNRAAGSGRDIARDR